MNTLWRQGTSGGVPNPKMEGFQVMDAVGESEAGAEDGPAEADGVTFFLPAIPAIKAVVGLLNDLRWKE